MKNKKIIKLYVITILLSIPFFYFVKIKKVEERANAPQIDVENELRIFVKKISFERNELYLNGAYYKANRITDYTNVYYNTNDSIKLDQINPPFLMQKKKNSDTLFIFKEGNPYYILIPNN
ncbi:hypothetical protein [Flavobacterium lindanitolerans]|jgi:hypothetical protein|uniref:hypothetical protein n=1 Tax=Flavobacterium lindanitolerans TaxID=428988 RepID=UPI0023F0AD41|nr:hypothetical protein [Flavobacterium lindanitolerans]